jgi:hypothetical protein
MPSTNPPTYTDINETGCCAVPDVEAWDRTIVHFDEKRFIRMCTRSMLYVPLNMPTVMEALQSAADGAGAAMPAREAMCLSRDLSPWKAEHLYAVTAPVDGVENEVITADLASMVFDGPYRDAKEWIAGVRAFAEESGRTPGDVFLFYATCPACSRHYGHNYVVALARLDDPAG